ncbi:FimV/HubP family polar landmark protein [Pseudomonas mosselii]|uniref:LysM peptidoglycan-binding domain-containing protein n=8 Tax=Pseudomonas mosselii TaxID=78327 RepID=A0ABX9B702_9PSED|nr:FimV/HubP family polar landmark protein [Pseudomonas mosselii]MCL8302916.1 LysM peptidoglycan-binding domain-containing protein [Pseudomonas mosselii]MCL8341697.1 LysM peptidoglycan-binding domain-containing protein [Pseudomonas mosselii]QZP28393.1 LysM peptidoglycan-binding domain-containing protein [Pseudomonas mosselii]WJR30390.1 FimV/HubP family polar landmark protein [Pseudomonas mosselii]
MLRIRKLVLAIAAASALSSGVANALGLGELTLKSAQNQPLDAEIELLDVRDLTAAQMAPSLASPEEFAKAGVAFPPYLEDLTFTPVINPNGKSVLRVTSSKALPEPVVKFLVQVMWPQGRLLRDYSVLLDQAQGSQPTQANINPAVSAGSYTTKRRDTLWQIAARNSNGGSIQQTMLAIQALNPDAFIGNNINQLKIGQVLRLPDQQQVQSIPQAQANREVAEQYAAWREGRRLGPRARQLDATRRGEAGAAPARIAQGDNLRLVAPGGKGAAGEAKALGDKLAVAQESLDTSRRDNEELKSRMVDLQSQLDKLQRLIELKNDQLARLEAQGAAAPQPPAGALPGEPAPAQPAVNAQLTPAEPVVAPAPAAADTAPQDVAAEAPASEEPGMLDQLLGNPLLLGLIAGSAFLVLLLLLLLLARKRKAQQEAEKHLRMARALAEDSERGPDLELPPSSFEGLDVSAPTVTLSPAVVAASAAAAVAAEKPAAPVEAAAPAVDPRAALLAEVDDSLARGRLNHAADLLEAAVASEPQRSDLRLKLMEVYARQGDQDAFAGQERKLAVNDANQAEVAALKERFPAMLGVAAVAAGAAGAAALAAELDEQYVQDLLQDKALELGESAPELVVEPVVAAQPEPVVDETDLDSAFDLSLGDDLPVDDHLDLAGLEDLAAEAPEVQAEPVPAIAETDADDDFEALLAQAQATPQNVDDLAEFDLDVAEEPVAPTSSEEAPVDVAAELAAFEAIPEFDPISELELPEDFDLSLSLDDDSPAAKNFASELDDVNAELDKLSQNLDIPAATPEPRFTAEDAALEPEPLDDLDFDFFSGADEVATKLDLARAYIDMGDHQGARDILDEVVKDGDDSQRQEANEMLSRLV